MRMQPKTLDSNFKKLLLSSKINLAERKVGKYQIKIAAIPQGEPITVVSHRNYFMMGYKPLKVVYDTLRIIYQLKDGEGLLMSDSPQEMFLQYDAYKSAKGKVLVGGLGIGLYATMIASKPDVTEVVVVELEKDIIKLCSPNPCSPEYKKIRIVNDDIWKFLENTKEKFDYIYIDIHYSTGAMEYMGTVLPMRKILKRRFPNTPASFWGEDEMKAQYVPERNDKNV